MEKDVDDERKARLAQRNEDRIIATYRERVLRWNQALRRSLLKAVCFIVSLTLLVTAVRLVSVTAATGFALGVFVVAFLAVLDTEPLPDRDTQSGDTIMGWLWVTLATVLVLSVLGLFVAGYGILAVYMIAGSLAMLFVGLLSNSMASHAIRGY